MRFAPGVTSDEYQDALRSEIGALFGADRVPEDESQIEAAAHALVLVSRITPAGNSTDPFFLRGGERA